MKMLSHNNKKSNKMNSVLRFLCRLIPAITFIFSGFVKAVDPTGTAVKFNDYFIAFNFDWLIIFSMPMAFALAVIEFLLGIYLLTGLFLKKVIPTLLAFMGFFTLLTLYIAIFDPVSDCGCFGDAIVISNWQTFIKNVIIIIFAYGAWLFRKEYKTPSSQLLQTITAVAFALYISGVAWYSLSNLPIIDFRPFKSGADIYSLIEIPEGAEMPEYETLFIMEKDGKQKTFDVDDYPYNDSTWVFIESKTKIIKEGYIPALEAFSLIDEEDGDITFDIIQHEGAVFLMVSHDLTKIPKKSIAPMTELSKEAAKLNIPFYCVTSSDSQEAAKFEKEHSSGLHYLYSDNITLKTIIRSNPGLILVYDGLVINKWHHNNIPDIKIMDNPLSYTLTEIRKKKTNLLLFSHIFGVLLIPVLLLTSNIIKTKK